MKIIFFLFSLFIINYSLLISIEVGGHLTEDTTWSPENNPYLVIDNIYVDEGVTLYILPGTEIKINGAPLTSTLDYDEYFWYQNGTNEAKMFWVDGRILAEGTEQDSIIFTRLQDNFDHYWGCIYMTEQSDLSIYKHCRLEYSGSIGIYVSRIAKGVLSIYNGKCIIYNNDISNNSAGVILRYITREMEIKNNSFYNDNLNNYVLNLWREHLTLGEPEEGFNPSLIANNYFDSNIHGIYAISSHFINNEVQNAIDNSVYLQGESGISYFYNNIFVDCNVGIGGGSGPLYIKNNRFIGGNEGIDIDNAYVEINDNYFEDCGVYTEFATGKVFNNVLVGDRMWTPGDIEVYNNIVYNSNSYGLKVGYNPYCVNNISINNEYAIWSATVSYENCIIIGNEELTEHNINGNPIFRNCILDFELPPECIDGGGNIWVDSLQAQQLFVDIENGDFHLIEGSLAIDAGFDTTGYYYPFDLDYSIRVWDGDNDGNAIIDIGPYEYNSPQFGGINGTVYQTENGEFLDYVLLKINNQPGEFTFADSIGNYEFKLPAGTYDIYAERVFYEDAVVYDIVVNEGEFTEIDFSMSSNVDVEDFTIPNQSEQIFHLSNYPNPFHSNTTISFELAKESDISISIYNIKGQKVKSLTNANYETGTHSVTWNGKDDNNKSVASGIYYYKLNMDGEDVSVRKCVLLR